MAHGFSDETLAIFMPIIVFWVSSAMYEILAYLRPDARLHSKEEEELLNIPSRRSVIKSALFQQALQILFVFLFLKITGNSESSLILQPSLALLAFQIFAAMVILDTVQYFGHRYMHINKFWYNYVHAVHHSLVVPYAVGSQHSHLLDGPLLDTVGGLLGATLTGMTPRTSMYFFSLATFRNVDIHCGLWLPWSPTQLLFSNNPAYHDSHHQLKGSRYNFAQPFFVSWDKILGTHMPFEVKKRNGGGYEVRPIKMK